MTVFIKRMMPKILVVILMSVVIILMHLVVRASQSPRSETDRISVYLWSADLMYDYAPYIQAQLPDIDIEFIVGNNDLDFYKFLAENDALPDIITNRRFSLYDAVHLQENLMDLSRTEAAATVCMPYLSNYQNSDGSINWLPICGVLDNIVANKALFDAYEIPLPTDYESFVAACQAFEQHGIRGFVSDFAYDYTCLEILQGLSISELNSLEGKNWRLAYEDPYSDTIGLDTMIWPKVFERMEQFITDVGLRDSDVSLNFEPLWQMFSEQKVAMIRETGTCPIHARKVGMEEVVMLPYFCQDGDRWLLTYPSLHVALNRNLEQDEKRKLQAFRILEVMLSEEGQNALAQTHDSVSYSKNTELELADELRCISSYIKANHLYIRLASKDFFAASKDVVQKMLLGEYDANQAYEAFETHLQSAKYDMPKEQETISFNRTIPYEFQNKGGNPAASAVANTLRNYYDADILISPAYNFTGPILNTAYNEEMVGNMIMPNSCEAFIREMTGKEVKMLIKLLVEGTEGCFAPFNASALPVLSGASMNVKEAGQHYKLTRVHLNGRNLQDSKVYKVAYLDPLVYCHQTLSQLYSEENLDTFKIQNIRVRLAWTSYMMEGHKLSAPTDYIILY